MWIKLKNVNLDKFRRPNCLDFLFVFTCFAAPALAAVQLQILIVKYVNLYFITPEGMRAVVVLLVLMIILLEYYIFGFPKLLAAYSFSMKVDLFNLKKKEAEK